MVLFLAFTLIALLAFANGANDVSKSVATLVGSNVADYHRALRWGAVWTTAGAILGGLFAGPLVERFARSLGDSAGQNAAIPISVTLASLAWVAFSSCAGLPVSTTHAITGAILGVGWAAQNASPWARADVAQGFLAPLLVSPLLAVALTLLLRPVLVRAGRWLDARCLCVVPSAELAQIVHGGAVASSSPTLVADRVARCEGRSSWSWNFSTDQAHWLSSGLVSLSRGMNDAPKIWALVIPLIALSGTPRRLFLPVAMCVVACAMGAGSLLAGRRVTEVLAERVTRMDAHEGFAANLATALLVVGASRLGLPVSTTHVSSGAIVGTGLGQGRRAVNGRVLLQIAMAWLVTLPVSGLAAMALYWLLG